jgi:hypothetical protein
MFLQLFLASMSMATGTGPMHAALEATEAPGTLRASFRVELSSSAARHVYAFDPRLEPGKRWQVISKQGRDPELDTVAHAWASEPAPDGRLFPDQLRLCLGQTVEVDTDGAAWRIGFRHHTKHTDTDFDRWAAERLQATAWLDPVGERFLRIDYALPRPVNVPNGGRLISYDQSYILHTEPRWGFTYVRAFAIELEARAAMRRIHRRYEAKVTDVQFFFSSASAEAEFLARASPGMSLTAGLAAAPR